MRILLSLAAMAAVATMATAANATNFIGTFDVTANQDGSQNGGLVINTNPDNGPINGATGFSLDEGQTFTVANLFTIYSPEGSVEGDDLHPKQITVDFDFSQPLPGFGDQLTGSTGAFVGLFSGGYVNWNSPVLMNFGNGGVLRVSLGDETFNNSFFTDLNQGPNHGAAVTARFKLVHDSLPGVPEPATWALMIGGFGMSGAMLRRRRLVMAA